MRTILVIALLSAAGLLTEGQTADKPLHAVSDPGVVTTRQAITPAGVPTVFQGRVYGVAFGKTSSDLWVANASELYRLDVKGNRIAEMIPTEGQPGMQGIAFDAAADRPLIVVNKRRAIGLYTALTPSRQGGDLKLIPIVEGLGQNVAGSVAIAGHIAVVALTPKNQIAVIDTQSAKLIGMAKTGIAPFGVVISKDAKVAYVSNWGGRVPVSGDKTAPAGRAADADPVVIDNRGIASTGTISRIDLTTLTVTNTIAVGLHPTGLAWDEGADRLYVANGNSDSVSEINTAATTFIRTLDLAPFNAKTPGIAPTALALSLDHNALYVACGGINAIAVVDRKEGRVNGLIPTAWYPNALVVSPDGRSIAVSTLLGAGPGWRDAPNKKYVHADRGSVAIIPIPDAAQLASYTAAVLFNNRMRPPEPGAMRPGAILMAQPAPIPVRSGDPSLIEHVLLIVKENRSYDQVFGDIEKGNGDPSLVMFGRDVTPNQHKLAEEFVLLDNFYATGGNSADGHQWITQANETDYALWPGYGGRSYPFDGTDPIAYSKEGFLWDYALARHRSVRVYGEYAPATRVPVANRQGYLQRWKNGDDFSHDWTVTSPIPPLNGVLAHNFPAFCTSIPDLARAQLFLAELKRMEQENSMPNLMLMELSSDHTRGTDPGESTPRAFVADNDYAVGQIVEGITKSKFWKNTLILIVEDDAQNGVDHVDGHRTVALAVSPYTRRGYVDSTFYSTQSMVKTIELILGLPTMSLFDLIAEDMRASFQSQPDLTSYRAVEPKVNLFEMNPPAKALRGEARKGAIASSKMNFSVPDAAPSEKLNRILWHDARGWSTPYPGARQAVFAPLSLDVSDEDRGHDDDGDHEAKSKSGPPKPK
jgi:DNA-binding beta-propeller fold protein YncE